jgi:hypothetical protein
MTLSSFISDIYASLTVTEVHAEAPPAEPEVEEAEPVKEEEPEAEEEEEEEPEDPFPALLEGRCLRRLQSPNGQPAQLSARTPEPKIRVVSNAC